MLASLSYMDDLEQIEFIEALCRLHRLIGAEIKATVNFQGEFFGCGLQGELNRIETLPPDHEAIALVLDERTGFYLDPADARVFVGRDSRNVELLEFRLDNGASVTLEAADRGDGP
jgi:hypothetical protein